MLKSLLGNIFDGGLFLQLCIEIPIMLILSSLMFGTVYGGIYQRNIEKDLCKEHREISGEGLHIIPDVAVYTFAGIIGFTYILFIAFQANIFFLPVRGFYRRALLMQNMQDRAFLSFAELPLLMSFCSFL